MLRLIATYLATAIAFAAVDYVWLSQLGPGVYHPTLDEVLRPINDPVDFPAAITFYLIYILGILLLAFWFILVRPQRSRAREQQELIQDLEPGDEIVSAGGFYGTITQIEGDVLHVEIAPGLIVRMARGAVAGIVETEELEATGEEEPQSPEDDSDEPGESPESRYPEAP